MNLIIDNKKFEVADWFANKNADMICESSNQVCGKETLFKKIKESEKAICVDPGNMDSTFWIPKSVLKKAGVFEVEKIQVSMYQKMSIEEFKDAFAPVLREFGEKTVIAAIKKAIKEKKFA